VTIETPQVGDVLEGMSLEQQFRRKVRVTKFIAILEACSYVLLAFFMFRKYALHNHTSANYLLLRVVAYFHGFICIAFAVMIFDIFRVLKWTPQFVLLTLLGPPGALVAHHRLRAQPIPAVIRKQDMLF
jgi:integral membrane protein